MAASAAKGVSTARPYQGGDPRDAAALRTKLGEAFQLWRDDVLTAAEYRTTRAELEGRLAAVEAQQRAAAGRDPLAGIAGRADAAKVWERLDLGRQRAILSTLLIVTVLPQRPGRMPDGSRFDTDAVRIEPAPRWQHTRPLPVGGSHQTVNSGGGATTLIGRRLKPWVSGAPLQVLGSAFYSC